ncbi:MAG: 1,4-beta-xylanase, partial [Ignavibacteriales bacterium]|nr:1,4-beta-xylanase [Ignavibacteriales bacterium]
ELQADWLEGIYTLAYSKPWVQNCSWFDFLDHRAFQLNGGLLRSEAGEKKAAWQRLQRLQDRWKTLAVPKK